MRWPLEPQRASPRQTAGPAGRWSPRPRSRKRAFVVAWFLQGSSASQGYRIRRAIGSHVAKIGVLVPDGAVECLIEILPGRDAQVGSGLDEVRPNGEALDRRRERRGGPEALDADPEGLRGLVGACPASVGAFLEPGD